MSEIEKCIVGCTEDYDCPRNKFCSKKEDGKTKLNMDWYIPNNKSDN